VSLCVVDIFFVDTKMMAALSLEQAGVDSIAIQENKCNHYNRYKENRMGVRADTTPIGQKFTELQIG
jgi:hypothetical protein